MGRVSVNLVDSLLNLRIQALNFSLKTLALVVFWISFVLALFAYARSSVMVGKGWSTRASSELLLVANILFMLFAISQAIGTFPKRDWLATSVVAGILVTMQLMHWLPTITAHTLGDKIVSLVTPAQNLGTSGWRDSHAAEFASLLLYSWTPFLALACGRVANMAAQNRANAG